MKPKRQDDPLSALREIVFARANDPARLALEPECPDIGALDLTLLSEIRRGAGGAVEVRLLNRLDAIKLLAELTGAGQSGDCEAFFKALETAAAREDGDS